MKIWIEPETGQSVTQGSAWAIAFLVVLIVLRTVVRSGLQYEAGAGLAQPGLINDGFVASPWACSPPSAPKWRFTCRA